MNNAQERALIVNHQSDLLTQDLVLSGVAEYSKLSDYGLSFDVPLIRYEHPSGDISYPKWQVVEFENKELSQDDQRKLIQFLTQELDKYRTYLELFKQETQSKDHAFQKVTTFFEKSKQSASTIPYFYLERSLQKILQREHISPEEIPSSMTDTSRASRELEHIYQQHKEEITRNRQKPQKLSQALLDDIENFRKRFAYLGMIYFKGEPWTKTKIVNMLLHITPQVAESEEEKKNLTPTAQTLSELLILRTEKWELMCYGAFLFRNFMVDFFSDLIPYDDILSLRIHELIDLFQDIYPPSDIQQRRKAFVLEINQKYDVVLTEEKQTEQVQERNDIHTEVKEIKGMTAQGGKIQARVKIILSPDDGDKIYDGDILVTKMSTPNFLPLMKKASAFITDIGGITSHAAIISREMKKPCIIGTQNATQILKDGDLVEVDADNGVVKILKKYDE